MAVPNLWRTKEQRYRLQGDVCPSCSNAIFPPKRVCPYCHHGAVTPVALPATMAEQQNQTYLLLFGMAQSTELNAVGDD